MIYRLSELQANIILSCMKTGSLAILRKSRKKTLSSLTISRQFNFFNSFLYSFPKSRKKSIVKISLAKQVLPNKLNKNLKTVRI